MFLTGFLLGLLDFNRVFIGLNLLDSTLDDTWILLSNFFEEIVDKFGCNFILSLLDLIQLVVGLLLILILLQLLLRNLNNLLFLTHLETLRYLRPPVLTIDI
jgi:hypothetical protein